MSSDMPIESPPLVMTLMISSSPCLAISAQSAKPRGFRRPRCHSSLAVLAAGNPIVPGADIPPTYGQFITQDEFNARYAPTADAEQRVADYLEANGFTVT